MAEFAFERMRDELANEAVNAMVTTLQIHGIDIDADGTERKECERIVAIAIGCKLLQYAADWQLRHD
jgi:hypothetical protein